MSRHFLPPRSGLHSSQDGSDIFVDRYETGLERGGQTREHARLLRAMGVFELIVACNKMDDGGWSRDRYEEIVASMSDFLAQCGYKVEAKVTFVPTSGQSDPPQLRAESSR